MKTNIAPLSKLGIPLALTLLLLNASLLCWYLFVGYQAGFHSDSAAKVLLAREIVETGKYFPNDWNYVNNDLFVIFGHTFIAPLLAVLPAGFLSHAISGLVSAALTLWAVWLLSGTALTNTAHRILLVSAIAGGISWFMAEHLFGQFAYGTLFYLACFLAFFSWKFITSENGTSWIWAAGVLVIVVLTFWTNPQRAVVYYGMPLVLAATAFRLRFQSLIPGEKKNRIWLLLIVAGAGALLGGYLHLTTIATVNNVLGAGHARWLPYESMLRNLAVTLKGIIALLGGLPSAGEPVLSRSGIHEAFRLVGALALIALVPIAIARALKQRSGGTVFLCLFALAQFLAIFFLQITTTIPDLGEYGGIGGVRYLIPAILLLIVVALAQPLNTSVSPLSGTAAVLAFTLLLTSAYSAYYSLGVNRTSSTTAPVKQHIKSNKALADFLTSNGLHYGYASFWNAGKVSVQSNEESLVRQIVIENGLPMPYRWLSSNRWYRPAAWQGETFIAVTLDESEDLDWDRIATYGVKPTRELSLEGFKVYVFPDNIAKHLPGWDMSYEKPATFAAGRNSHTQIGRFIDGTSQSNAVLVADRGQSGALHFGPYVGVEAGEYVATFKVHSRGNPAGAFRIDVSSAPDGKILGEKTLTSGNQSQEIIFTVDKSRKMEFRVWSFGHEEVAFESVTVKRLSAPKKSETSNPPIGN